MNKKSVYLWYLYDFANSFASIVLIFYYPLILQERGASDAWIGISASISTGILLIILPYLGENSDKTGRRIYFIKIASILMILSLVVIAGIAQKIAIFNLPILLVLSALYILFQVCFQGSYVFYTAILREISNNENNVKISGIGLGLGQLGNALSLGIIGPIVGSGLVLIGMSGKPLALVAGGLVFGILAIPFLKQKEIRQTKESIRFSYKNFIRKIYAQKRIFWFLVGYSLLADSILTFQLYIAIYIKKVFNYGDQLIAYAGITGLVFGIVGAFLANQFVKKLKNNKEYALSIASIMYSCCFALCALMPNVPVVPFVGLAISGISYGLLFSLARSVYSEITPAESQGEFFSVFTVFERAASVVGPLVWIGTFYALGGFGENIQYRGSVLFLMLICFLGYYFLQKSRKYT